MVAIGFRRALSACMMAALLAPAPTRAETEVDLALVLAVDISFSMDSDEQALQREGFVAALRSPMVHDAIRRGTIGKIALTYAEWAGTHDRRVVVPWTILDTPESANAFADRLAESPLRRATRTSISGAIDQGVELLAASGVTALRQVIDVSGDGPNNEGRIVTLARDEALARGITINGLPIMLKRPGYLDISSLDAYYTDCVIGGQGAFVVPVREAEQFPAAIKTKIILEIAGVAPPRPLVQAAQASGRSDCLIGERQWRERMGN